MTAPEGRRRLGVLLPVAALALLLGWVPSYAAGTANPAGPLVRSTRAQTARYRDVQAAMAAGYRPQQTDGAVVHYVNARYLNDDRVLDPRRPESLVYLRGRSGLRLVAAMFLMARPGERGPAIGGSRAGWHTHTSCWGSGGLGIPVPGGSCPAGTNPVRTSEMLHVWLVDVPGGPFAIDMSTPIFHCGARA